MIGWVFDETWAQSNHAAIAGFLRASSAAKRILLDSDAEWLRLKPMLKVSDDQGLGALRDAYRDGIPRGFDAEQRQAIERVFQILATQGGEDLVGSKSTLAPGTFWSGFDLASW
jgi:NitT/TauT family transport system substrate-binding protein